MVGNPDRRLPAQPVRRTPLIHICMVGFGWQRSCPWRARHVPVRRRRPRGLIVLSGMTTVDAVRRSSWEPVRSFARRGSSRTTQRCPRRAGRSPGWPEVWHPDDLPEGYHTPARGQSCTRLAAGCVEGCPRTGARSGCARSTGCHTSRGAVWRSKPGANHLPPPATPRDAQARRHSSSGYRAAALPVTSQQPVSAFGTKRSPSISRCRVGPRENQDAASPLASPPGPAKPGARWRQRSTSAGSRKSSAARSAVPDSCQLHTHNDTSYDHPQAAMLVHQQLHRGDPYKSDVTPDDDSPVEPLPRTGRLRCRTTGWVHARRVHSVVTPSLVPGPELRRPRVKKQSSGVMCSRPALSASLLYQRMRG